MTGYLSGIFCVTKHITKPPVFALGGEVLGYGMFGLFMLSGFSGIGI
jgi:hypothetical protein